MKEILPLIILAVLFIGLMMFSRRNREKAAQADRARRQKLRPGSQIMTTSGLYATVVSVNAEDDSVLLSIAAGVEVKWTIAALREVDELPTQYREAAAPVDGAGLPIDGPGTDDRDTA